MSRVRAYAGYTTGGYAFVLKINNFDDVEDPHSEWVEKIVEIL